MPLSWVAKGSHFFSLPKRFRQPQSVRRLPPYGVSHGHELEKPVPSTALSPAKWVTNLSEKSLTADRSMHSRIMRCQLKHKTAAMQKYHHDFKTAEDYLHHRVPYLLVDRIVSIADTEVVATKKITGEEFFIEGHFPGAPIFPGAMMQELSTQTAGILIAARYNPMLHFDSHDPSFNEFALGVLVRVNYAKYKGFARPGETLVAKVLLNEQVENMFDFSSTISIDDKPIMRNSFRLTNIKSSLLYAD